MGTPGHGHVTLFMTHPLYPIGIWPASGKAFVCSYFHTLTHTHTYPCRCVCLPEVPIKLTHFSGEFSGKLGAESHSRSTRIVSLDENFSHVSTRRHRLSLYLYTDNTIYLVLCSLSGQHLLAIAFAKFLFYSLN